MQLAVDLVDGASYAATASSLPLLYRVTFENETMISGSINVTACILENLRNNKVCVGYAGNITSLPGAKRLIEAGTVVVLSVDALEHEEGLNDLIPGEYEVSAKVAVQVVKPDGSLRHQDLRATRQLVLV